MNREEFIDMSKRMVVEYYNRYVHNAEPDYADIKVDPSFIDILEENYNSNGTMEVVMQVIIDLWLEYHIIYNPNSKEKISSFVTLS